MNNFGITLKKFITNKNTVTVIGVILIVLLLYWGYSSTVKKSVDPINVPVAATRLTSGHKITYDDIAYKKVSKVVLDENVITHSDEIVGNFVTISVTIPQGSMFYGEWLVNEENVPGKWIENVDFANGEEAYYFSTDAIQTLGNSVLPDSYIDIYMKAEDENGNIMVGKLLENIKVLVVHDATGNNVFADSNNIGIPSFLGFALKHDFYILLQKTERLQGLGIELILAPQGVTPQIIGGENTVFVGSEILRDYIDANTVSLDDEHVESKIDTTTDLQNTTESQNLNENPTNNVE